MMPVRAYVGIVSPHGYKMMKSDGIEGIKMRSQEWRGAAIEVAPRQRGLGTPPLRPFWRGFPTVNHQKAGA